MWGVAKSSFKRTFGKISKLLDSYLCGGRGLMMEIIRFRKYFRTLLYIGLHNNIKMNFLANTIKNSLLRGLTLSRVASINGPLAGSSEPQMAKSLLLPQLPNILPANGFKLRYAVKKRCQDCYLVIRDNRLFNICPTHPRHKQMSLTPHPKKLRIITWAGQSKKRPW